MLLKRSARFAVAVDGTVTVRRRPLVTACHLLGDALERFDGVLDEVPAYVSDGSRRRWHQHGCWGCRLRLSKLWLPLLDAGDR